MKKENTGGRGETGDEKKGTKTTLKMGVEKEKEKQRKNKAEWNKGGGDTRGRNETKIKQREEERAGWGVKSLFLFGSPPKGPSHPGWGGK